MPARTQSVARVLDSMFRAVVIALAVYGGLDLVRAAIADDPSTAYLPAVAKAEEVQSLEERVAALEDLLQHVSRDGNELYVTGANLHVVSGTGATDGITNGLGNVIIGYNEERTWEGSINDRSGSHMLVVGRENNYRNVGGIVVGVGNTTAGAFSSVSGGYGNEAVGLAASVSGGWGNRATGESASVSGGVYNEAVGTYSSVTGGGGNSAVGGAASATGGTQNFASEWWASVSGGLGNRATGESASVSGGVYNEAVGTGSSVSGGGGNRASGEYASVSGGQDRSAESDYGWRAGELFQENWPPSEAPLGIVTNTRR